LKTRITGISISEELYKKLETKRGSISRSRFYCELLKLGLDAKEDENVF